MNDHIFSREELGRYNRHLIIPGFGLEAQTKLKQAKVLVAGCGGLGSPLLLYLAAAGIGTIGLVDFDLVDDSNLQRQVLFSTNDLGRSKSETARQKLQALNPHIQLVSYNQLLTVDNIEEIISGYDVIADGTDNFPSRYLINDACVLLGKPLVYAAVYQFEGQVAVFNHLGGPNYRDLYPTPPADGILQNCAEGGVLGVLPGIIGSLQALEVIKLITGLGELLNGKLYNFDALSLEGRSFRLKKNPANPLYISGASLQSLADYDQLCGPAELQSAINEISPADFETLRSSGDQYQLIDVREPWEYETANLGGDLIPLSSVTDQAAKITRDKPVIIHCKSGVRSRQAIEMLQEQFGFTNLMNLHGGIDAVEASGIRHEV